MKLLLIFTSIILIMLSIPPIAFDFLGWFALVPFFILLLKSNKSIKYSFIFGIVLGAIIYSFVLLIYDRSLIVRITGFLTLSIFQGLFFASYAYAIKVIQKNIDHEIIKIILSSITWVAIEVITNRLFFGFTIYIAMLQHSNYRLLSLGKYIGAYGISFIVILINILITKSLLYLEQSDEALNFKTIKKLLAYVMAIAIILLATFILPFHNVNKLAEKNINTSLIQGNISSYEYELANKNEKYSRKIFNKYFNLSQKSVDKHNPELIIWPESAVHRNLMRLPEYRDELYRFAEKNQVYILLGSLDLTQEGEEYNSAFLISPEGKMVGRYNKNILVPALESRFYEGDSLGLINSNSINAGIIICFESLFPDYSVRLNRKGANVFFVLSNNGMFSYTLAPYLTSVFSIFRAVENNVYTAQVMNTGVTKIVSPRGEVIKSTNIYEEDILNYDLPITSDRKLTFYAAYGQYIYYFISVLLVGFILHLSIK